MGGKKKKALVIFYSAKGFGPPWDEGLKNTLYSWMGMLAGEWEFHLICDRDFQDPGLRLYYQPRRPGFWGKYLYLWRLCERARGVCREQGIDCLWFAVLDYSILLPLWRLRKLPCRRVLAPASRKFIERVEFRKRDICEAPFFLKRFIFASFERVVCLSRTLRREILGQGVIDAERAVYLPPHPLRREELRPPAEEGRGNGREELVIAHLGSFAPERGVEVILRAVRFLNNPRLRVRLAWEGSVGSRPALQELIGELGLEGQVSFFGTVDVPSFLAESDLYVFPMLKRNHVIDSPLSLIEAMLMARVVAASDFPNYRELISHGESGYLFPSGDYRALARIIDELFRQPVLLRRVGEGARERVLGIYSRCGAREVARAFFN